MLEDVQKDQLKDCVRRQRLFEESLQRAEDEERRERERKERKKREEERARKEKAALKRRGQESLRELVMHATGREKWPRVTQ